MCFCVIDRSWSLQNAVSGMVFLGGLGESSVLNLLSLRASHASIILIKFKY